jgi:cell wall-associated NlpC family hydrolase
MSAIMTKEYEVAEKLILGTKQFQWHVSDCWTLACNFYRDCYSISIPKYQYGETNVAPPDAAYLDWQAIDEHDLIPGDLLIGNVNGIIHVGVFLGNAEFLHASQVKGEYPVRISKLSTWRRTFTIFARHKQRLVSAA